MKRFVRETPVLVTQVQRHPADGAGQSVNFPDAAAPLYRSDPVIRLHLVERAFHAVKDAPEDDGGGKRGQRERDRRRGPQPQEL